MVNLLLSSTLARRRVAVVSKATPSKLLPRVPLDTCVTSYGLGLVVLYAMVSKIWLSYRKYGKLDRLIEYLGKNHRRDQ